MKKAVLDELFAKALSALIDHNNGSMEDALDDMGVDTEEERDIIKDWYGWEDEEDYDDYEEDED